MNFQYLFNKMTIIESCVSTEYDFENDILNKSFCKKTEMIDYDIESFVNECFMSIIF